MQIQLRPRSIQHTTASHAMGDIHTHPPSQPRRKYNNLTLANFLSSIIDRYSTELALIIVYPPPIDMSWAGRATGDGCIIGALVYEQRGLGIIPHRGLQDKQPIIQGTNMEGGRGSPGYSTSTLTIETFLCQERGC